MTSQQPEEVKARLKSKGWTNRAAAERVGVTFEHLNRVLNGHRESARLLTKLDRLPQAKKRAKSPR